jgi:integrase
MIAQNARPTFCALIAFAAGTRARRTEIQTLEWKDIDLTNAVVLIRQTRGQRKVPLTKPLVKALRKFPGEHEPASRVFVGTDGAPMSST